MPWNSDNKYKRWLSPLADIYREAARARRRAYEEGRKRRKRLPRPVLSVGNLTVGGTGKTPTVLYLVQKLSGWCQVAILSRGYGRKGARSYQALPSARVLDDRAALFFGDEPVLLARRLPSTSVHVGPNRYSAGLKALDRRPIDLFVLDDGFQHVELERDIDMITLDGQQDPRELKPLPAGPLREPVDALKRADIVLINHVNADGSHEIDLDWLRSLCPEAPIVTARLEPSGIYECRTGNLIDREEIESIPLYAFSGICNPESFHLTLREQGFQIKDHRAFPDHYRYKARDIQLLNREARSIGAKGFITTEKDSVRICGDRLPELPLYYVEVSLRILEGEEAMWERIGDVLHAG